MRMVFPEGGRSCNKPRLKFHVIKVNKDKIRPWARDTYSKLNVGAKYPSGHHLLCFMAKGKLEKAMAKALKRKKSIFGIYL